MLSFLALALLIFVVSKVIGLIAKGVQIRAEQKSHDALYADAEAEAVEAVAAFVALSEAAEKADAALLTAQEAISHIDDGETAAVALDEHVTVPEFRK